MTVVSNCLTCYNKSKKGVCSMLDYDIKVLYCGENYTLLEIDLFYEDGYKGKKLLCIDDMKLLWQYDVKEEKFIGGKEDKKRD